MKSKKFPHGRWISEATYDRATSATFKKVKEQYGGLSNMAGGYPLVVAGVPIRTSEALYQAMRFPLDPDVQRLIIEQPSPMAAKMVGKPHRAEKCRDDWDEVRVDIMRWCLRVKLIQNWEKFWELLDSTGDLPIVEESHKDQFWGDDVRKGWLIPSLCIEPPYDAITTFREPGRESRPPFALLGREIGLTTSEKTKHEGEK